MFFLNIIVFICFKANYDEEIKIHSKRLDNWYDICMDCQITVQQELQKQDAMLSRKLMSHDQQVPADSVSNDVVKEKTAVVMLML